MNSILKFVLFFAINLVIILAVMKTLDARNGGSHSSADLARVALRDYPNGKIDFDLLAAGEFDEQTRVATFKKDLADLDGKEVEIIGFMMPAADAFSFRTFILVNFPTGCKICPVGSMKDQVYIDVDFKNTPPDKTTGMVRIKGRLLLSHEKPVYYHPMLDEFIYVIDRAEVEEFTDE